MAFNHFEDWLIIKESAVWVIHVNTFKCKDVYVHKTFGLGLTCTLIYYRIDRFQSLAIKVLTFGMVWPLVTYNGTYVCWYVYEATNNFKHFPVEIVQWKFIQSAAISFLALEASQFIWINLWNVFVCHYPGNVQQLPWLHVRSTNWRRKG